MVRGDLTIYMYRRVSSSFISGYLDKSGGSGGGGLPYLILAAVRARHNDRRPCTHARIKDFAAIIHIYI